MPALMAIGAFWRHQSWCFVLEVFKDQLNHLGIFDAGNDFGLATAVFTASISILKMGLSRCTEVMARWRCAGLLSPQPVSGTSVLPGFLSRLAGVT